MRVLTTRQPTDITEIPANDGKLYISAIFDCFDASVLGISMADNMRAELYVQTVENACVNYPEMRGAVLHSDRGSQYTSEKYRAAIVDFGIIQSMNSAGGRCHDNARCESMWARMKDELFYLRKRKTGKFHGWGAANADLAVLYELLEQSSEFRPLKNVGDITRIPIRKHNRYGHIVAGSQKVLVF